MLLAAVVGVGVVAARGLGVDWGGDGGSGQCQMLSSSSPSVPANFIEMRNFRTRQTGRKRDAGAGAIFFGAPTAPLETSCGHTLAVLVPRFNSNNYFHTIEHPFDAW